MNPILYEQTETAFTSQGIGVLSDTISCLVTEELDNLYELEMTYPVNGVFYDQLTLRRIIKAKPNQTDDPQPFRIYKITKPMDGRITVCARHISYDLSGMVVPPFSNITTVAGAIATITATALPTINPFTFTNNATSRTGTLAKEDPASAREVLGSIVDTFGVDVSYNKFNITISTTRGSSNGVVISYGKNLIDLVQEQNCDEICTGVYPFFRSEEGTVTLTEKIINLPGTYDFTRIIPLDLSGEFQNSVPTQQQLRDAANAYISKHNLGVPKVNLTVKLVSVIDSDGAIPLDEYEKINLGDTIGVRFEKLGVEALSRCVKYVYDPLKDQIDSIVIGDRTVTFTESMALHPDIDSEIKQALQTAVARATNLITNGMGGYVMLHKSNPSYTHPDELLILGDSPDLSQAQQVWRWNKNGLAHSSTGYNGTYSTAITSDGQIVADMITTGVLRAIEIHNTATGVGTFHVTSGGHVTATAGSIGGFNIDSESIYNNAISLHNTGGLRIKNGNNVIGRVSSIGSDGRTVGFILSEYGTTMSWGVEDSNGNISTVLSYNKTNNKLEMFCPLDMHSYQINNCVIDTTSQRTGIRHSYIVVNPSGNYYVMTIQTYIDYYNAMGQFCEQVLESTNNYNIRKA